MLSQQHQDGEHAIAFGSRALTKTEKPYSVTRKELLSLVYFLKHFRQHLYGYHVVVRTDHKALQWLRSFREPEGQVARWLVILKEYDLEIHHRPGNKHSNADALSRIPPTDAGLPLETFVLTERDASDSPSTPGADVLTRSRDDTDEQGGQISSWSKLQLQATQMADADIKTVVPRHSWCYTDSTQPVGTMGAPSGEGCQSSLPAVGVPSRGYCCPTYNSLFL